MSQPDWPEEGQRPDREHRPGQRPPDDWDQAPAPPSGMSGGMKACIIIVCVLGFCCVLCCGVFGYLGYTMMPKVSENPADVDATRAAICKIDLPAGFKPKSSIKVDNFFMSMPMVVYEDPGHATLMLMEMHVKIQGGDFNNQMMRQQFEQKRSIEVGRLENSKTETKTIKIKGQDCQFTITTGEQRSPAGGGGKGGDGKADPGKAGGKKNIRHAIEGSFEGNGGAAIIVINFDDTYKEADIIKMLENIQ
jgi:hypothetical protein